MTSDPDQPFSVDPQDGAYRVVYGADYTILECATEANAQHYLVLLTQAYRFGYKAGYRAARNE